MIKEWFNIIILLGAGQGLLLAILLISKSENRKANIFFSFLISLVSLKLLIPIIYNLLHPIVNIINETSILLFAPLHFLYAYYTIYQKKINLFIHIILFSPFVLLILFHVLYYHSTEQLLINSPLYIHSFVIGSAIFSLLIMIYLLKIVKAYKKDLSNKYSSIDKINLNWLVLISSIILIIDISVLGLYMFSSLIEINLLSIISRLGILLAILIFITGYLVLNQPKIPYIEVKDIERYATSGLKELKSQEIENKLRILMQEEKVYLKEKLSLTELSEKIGERETYVSQVINESYGLNFYNLIAKYRVEEAAKRMRSEEYDHLTLLAIAYDVGFGSKSTFNSAFKKHKGLTPSQYKNSKSYIKPNK